MRRFVLPAGASADTIPGRYIVVLKDSVGDPAAVATEHGRKYGVERSFTYGNAIKGYAAAMSEGAANQLRADPHVLSVSPDEEIHPAASPPACTDLTICQRLSTGVDRIDGDLSSTRSGDGSGSVPINVAVVDTGIQTDHPDLNVIGGTDCAKGDGFDDPEGHGTGVAGLIGARDNSIGRVGVAPGARLWAIRVFDPKGQTTHDSNLICGLDAVAASSTDQDPTNDIAVANISIGGPTNDKAGCQTTTDALHLATCRTSAAGVVVVVSAGNEKRDLARSAPATFDEVLTATAMDDVDGQPGGLGGTDCLKTETDDTPATFSDFATQAQDQAHTVAAPGVCLGSTFIGSAYAGGSGTSFSAPIVSGTVALCIYSGPCKGLAPAQVIDKIVGDARVYSESRKGSGFGFQGDPLRPIPGKYYGYLIRAGGY